MGIETNNFIKTVNFLSKQGKTFKDNIDIFIPSC